MDILQFIASLVSSLAWPMAVVILGILFRSQVTALLKKLRTLSWGDAKADFSDKLDRLETVSNATLPPNVAPAIPPALDYKPTREEERFDKLLAISPTAAILETWRQIEDEVAKVASKVGVQTDARNMKRLMNQLVERGVLDAGSAHMFEDLRGLRNVAAHRSDRELTTADAIRFQELAAKALSHLTAITDA